ncbi:MAG: threonine--tRNA ligase [Firmicutes bacterium]|nr:threonine--tRNA ligase [Bacillota bacterium]
MSVTVTFPDGNSRSFENNVTIFEVADSISHKLAKNALAGEVDGKVMDLSTVLDHDVELKILTWDDEEGKTVFRHSSSHLLAEAVQNLFPGTKFGIGPAIKDGFYYDFDSEHTFTESDFEAIEKEMARLAAQNNAFTRKVISREEALKYFEEKGEKYKVELINDLPEDAEISTYQQGGFLDLCAGPHLPSTDKIKAVKVMSIAGAYWRGNEKNKMLQRVYCTSFPKKAQLDEYLTLLEEAKKRDHRKLGQELGLFTIMEEGPGFPFFLPKGMILRNELESYWREIHKAAKYDEIRTPMILNRALWEQSGHWDHYKDNMYFTKIDEGDYAIKPMNCPGSILVYNNSLHSYREFPLRMGELGLVHRHEKSGALHGLMRVRCFTQDDAHIFMLESQIKDEIKGVIKLIDSVYSLFGFEYHLELSTRPEDSMGSEELWEVATNALQEAMDEEGLAYQINEGDGAFYGPKIDFHLTDCLGRTWQCGTIQLDFQLPEKFDMTYIGEDGEKHRPVMIHRVCFGSIERFIGILTEHFAGAFPTWLSPVQVRLMSITDKQLPYIEEICEKMQAKGIRAEVDRRNEKIGYKIRESVSQKIPYSLVAGDKEVENGEISVRRLGKGDIGSKNVDELIETILEEIRTRANN